jgi:hypothetical protein
VLKYFQIFSVPWDEAVDESSWWVFIWHIELNDKLAHWFKNISGNSEEENCHQYRVETRMRKKKSSSAFLNGKAKNRNSKSGDAIPSPRSICSNIFRFLRWVVVPHEHIVFVTYFGGGPWSEKSGHIHVLIALSRQSVAVRRERDCWNPPMHNVRSGKCGRHSQLRYSPQDFWHSHKFSILARFRFFVLTDVWRGVLWLCRIAHYLYRSIPKKRRINHVKIESIILYFSHPGLFRIRVSTLYFIRCGFSIRIEWAYF